MEVRRILHVGGRLAFFLRILPWCRMDGNPIGLKSSTQINRIRNFVEIQKQAELKNIISRKVALSMEQVTLAFIKFPAFQ